jgi:NhaC family Na+:H+ antiporter
MYKSVGGLLKDLLSRGGLSSMLGTIALILIGAHARGVMETCGYLEVILERRSGRRFAPSEGLITSVIASCIFANMFLGDQYLAIVIPGRMFKPGSKSSKPAQETRPPNALALSGRLRNAHVRPWFPGTHAARTTAAFLGPDWNTSRTPF